MLAVALSTVHLISVIGNERGISKVSSSVISLSKVPVTIIFPFSAQSSVSICSILKVGGVIFVLFLFSSMDKS